MRVPWCLDCKSGAQLLTSRAFDRFESAGKLPHRLSLPDLVTAVWPRSALPGQSDCARSSKKLAGSPWDQWAPVSMVPGNAGNRRLIPAPGQYWPANHRSGDQIAFRATVMERNIGVIGDLTDVSFAKSKGPVMSTRFQIALLIFMMANAVAFGVGIVLVLMIPVLAAYAFEAIPAIVVASFLVSAPAAWFIAPTLRSRYQRAHSH